MVIESINPATLEKIGEVEETELDEIKRFFQKAREVQIMWRNLTILERARKVAKINKQIVNQLEEISKLISKEVGKPPCEAYVSEVYVAVDSTYYYYKNIERFIGKEEDLSLAFYESLGKKSSIFYQPAGVVAVIGPYNYPFIIPFEQIIQSLMAGNAVIFKPSSDTVLTGLKIQELFDTIEEIPTGLIKTVFGSGKTVGSLMINEADRVIFTGSTETGKIIMKTAADTLTPVCLELGGKSAMVVLPDANIERGVMGARWGCFTNSGQVCSSVKRLYLHDEIKEKFTQMLVEKTKALKQGNPMEKGVDIGAMINKFQMEKVLEMIETAKEEGAKILCGGRRNPNLEGYFIEPTILEECTNDMKCVQEEIFGPVLPILQFSNHDEVIEMVNDNKYGLTSSIWSNDIKKAKDIALKINSGTVMINNCVYTFGLAATPWGGTKHSGIGRTHGKFGFHEVTSPIHINIDRSDSSDVWWMPYDKEFKEYMDNFMTISKSLIINE
ncbi:MAG: aldehyde dehydrogenase family protein [Candidatus Lokiarchaeota archaeon]|nr:aldehyde dehydrogenase family protein [Candidatus Lokiarchaeota archaeon]